MPRGHAGRRLRLVATGVAWAIALAAVGLAVLLTRAPTEPVLASAGIPHADQISVLFIGNSFTTENKMPFMLERLAAAAHARRRPYVYVLAGGGAKLSDHATAGLAPKLIGGWSWDYVVLQEHTEFASSPALRDVTLRSGRTLQRMIDGSGAKTLLYATWGYPHGERAGDSFAAMEARDEAGYRALARELRPEATVPAGRAFAEAVRLRPGIRLWQADEIHPTRAGSYLVACVFYRTIYHRSAVGNGYTDVLDRGTARFLQRVADAVA
jgi:hypothetical protein